MAIEVRPATRFADVATMLGPKKDPDGNVCWCLSHRVDSRTNQSLQRRERGEYVRKLVRRKVPPGVLAYDGDEVCGWAGTAPRAELPVVRSTKIDAYDDQPVWSIFCVRVRPGFRGRGITLALVEGAVDLAREHGAPAVEAIPVDNDGQEGRPDHGVRRHPRAVREGRLREGRRHPLGHRRLPAGRHATLTVMTEVLADGFAFPECPVWHDGALWFSDVYAGRVHRLADGTAEVVAEVDGHPAGLGFLPDGRLLVAEGLSRQVLRLEPDGSLVTHADLSEVATWHLNDMHVDAAGRAYVGNYGDASVPPAPPHPAALALVQPSGEVSSAAAGMMFANGIDALADGRTLVVAETRSTPGRLTAFTVAASGELSDRRVLAELDVMPDGIAVAPGRLGLGRLAVHQRAAARLPRRRGGRAARRAHAVRRRAGRSPTATSSWSARARPGSRTSRCATSRGRSCGCAEPAHSQFLGW